MDYKAADWNHPKSDVTTNGELLSVLIPVHNEALGIPSIYSRVVKTLEAGTLKTWQIVFLNNASTDDSLGVILNLRQKDARVKVITLSRNFGYQGSLMAGVTTIESDLYAIVDGDGEDPPELFSEFLKQIQQGAQLVYGIRSQRDEPKLVTWFRGLFYHINQWIADSDIVLWMAEFAMFTREVRDAVIAQQTTYPFLRAELAFVGFRRIGVPYQRGQRSFGESHYNFYQMTKFAVGGFLASSTFPLRLILYTASFIGVCLPLVAWLRHWSIFQTALIAGLLLFYFVLLSGSMGALYLARTYKNTVRRPIFIINPQGTELTS